MFYLKKSMPCWADIFADRGQLVAMLDEEAQEDMRANNNLHFFILGKM